jgi:hypothetical protein
MGQTQAGGFYYLGNTAVDADGNAIEGAPARQKDTDPSMQPGASGVQTAEERIAVALAAALKGTGVAKKSAAQDEDDDAAGSDMKKGAAPAKKK